MRVSKFSVGGRTVFGSNDDSRRICVHFNSTVVPCGSLRIGALKDRIGAIALFRGGG